MNFNRYRANSTKKVSEKNIDKNNKFDKLRNMEKKIYPDGNLNEDSSLMSSSISDFKEKEEYAKKVMDNQEYDLSDVDVDDIEDPREREIILLSKIKVLRDKLKYKS